MVMKMVKKYKLLKELSKKTVPDGEFRVKGKKANPGAVFELFNYPPTMEEADPFYFFPSSNKVLFTARLSWIKTHPKFFKPIK